MPYGLTANVGAEYDYSDGKEKRCAIFTFRIGIPFGKGKGSEYNRMFKPIVRDVDVRIDENIVTEDATVHMIDDRTTHDFHEIVEVTTEEELHQAIAAEQGGDVLRAIIIKGDILAIRPIKLTNTQRIIGDNMKLKFAGKTLEKHKEILPHVKTPQLSHLSLDNNGNVHNVTVVDAEIYYDDVKYSSIDFVSTEEEFQSAVEKENGIIVLDDDIEITKRYHSQETPSLLVKAKLQ